MTLEAGRFCFQIWYGTMMLVIVTIFTIISFTFSLLWSDPKRNTGLATPGALTHCLKYLVTEIEKWPSRAKRGQEGPSGAKRGQMRPFFCMQAGVFLWDGNILFCESGTQTKICRAMGILLILRFWFGSTKRSVTFLILVRGKLISMDLFWATTSIHLVPPAWLKKLIFSQS